MRLSALSFIGISTLLLIACNTSSQSGIKVPEVIQPGEQAPFADPGQRNFGVSEERLNRQCSCTTPEIPDT